jgi:chromosomal replication initiation ATPase DnaA
MKHTFVKTENHRRFLASASMLENRGSVERCLLPVIGDPGVGKTCVVDHWGSATDAVLLEGIPGMSLAYLKAALKAETGIKERGGFAEFKALVEFFRGDPARGEAARPIILDECQHGFPHKAECIEFLRRLAEKAQTILVLVCHTSEAYLLEKHDHIKSRVGCVCKLMPPSLEDATLYARELCEVALDDALVGRVFQQSGARYRLISDALANLERIAEKLGKPALTLEDVRDLPLCQDWEKALKPSVQKKAAAQRSVHGGRK